MKEFFSFLSALLLGLGLGMSAGSFWTERLVLERACGPCDHVAECGGYQCRVGVEGWQKGDN